MAASITHGIPTYTAIALPGAEPGAVNVTLPANALAATLALEVAGQVLEIRPNGAGGFVQVSGAIELIPDAIQLGKQLTYKAWSSAGAVGAILTTWS